mgnify:CR=1 FL=1
MRDFHQELAARTRLRDITDSIFVVLGFVSMFALFLWMACTI